MAREETIWAEKYRPKKIDDIIISQDIKDKFNDYVAKGRIDQNICLWGSTGTGKTTMAKALIKELGADSVFYNGRDVGIDVIKTDIQSFAKSVSLLGNQKIVLIDEANLLSSAAMEFLKTFLEEVSSNCVFILTSNKNPEFFRATADGAINSRVSFIEFKVDQKEKLKLAKQFYARIIEILKKENVTFDKNVVMEVIKKLYPDNRKILVELQQYTINNNIAVSILDKLVGNDLKGLIQLIQDKDYAKCNDWINTNYDLSGDIYSRLCLVLYDMIMPDSIEVLIQDSNESQYKHAFVPDKGLNLKAYVLSLILQLNWK